MLAGGSWKITSWPSIQLKGIQGAILLLLLSFQIPQAPKGVPLKVD